MLFCQKAKKGSKRKEGEREKSYLKKRVAENFTNPNLKEEMEIQFQEAGRIPIRTFKKAYTKTHSHRTAKFNNKERIMKAARE